MFWKVVGGIVAFFMVVVLGLTMLAVTGAAIAGVTVASLVENLDIRTVQVTDSSGHTETVDVADLFGESGRIEVNGDNGERVTVDLNLPQITVDDGSGDSAQVIIGGERGFGIDPQVPQVRVNGRSIDRFDGGWEWRPVERVFEALARLAFWTLVAVGIWLVVRNRRTDENVIVEKSPDATA
jgi:hypothetical protein